MTDKSILSARRMSQQCTMLHTLNTLKMCLLFLDAQVFAGLERDNESLHSTSGLT